MRNFIGSCKTQATKNSYSNNFARFLAWSGVRAAKLLTKKPKLLQQDIINFLEEEKARGLSYKSLSLLLSAIKHFFESNDYDGLNWKRIQKHLPEHVRFKDRAYSVEEIRQMLGAADQRMRVFILLMAGGGLRVGAIPGLKVGDLEKMDSLYKVTVYSGSKEEYTGFLTPECSNEIDSYLDFRRRAGETITSKSPLVREQFDKDDPEAAKKPHPLKLGTVTYLVRNVLLDAGLRSRTNHDRHRRSETMLNHALRKFWNTQMVRAGVKHDNKELLIGHKSRGLESSYYRPELDDLLTDFKKAIPFLTISQEAKLQKQVEKLKIENASDMAEVKRLYEDTQAQLARERFNSKETMVLMWQFMQETDPAKKNELSQRLAELGFKI